MLIANKSDFANEDRQVSVEEGRELSQKYGVDFFEVSALDGSNISQIFMSLCRSILEKNPKFAINEPGKNLKLTKSGNN